MKRPNMAAYFKAHIDRRVNGMLSTATPRLPEGVHRTSGSVTDPVITVTMLDGTEWKWRGGRYASRKVNGCYAPLMPTPIP